MVCGGTRQCKRGRQLGQKSIKEEDKGKLTKVKIVLH